MDLFLTFVANHPLLFAALAVVILLLIANEVHGGLTAGKRLSATEAVRLINDRDPLVIDVRPAGDFKKGHLLHAQSVPLTKLDGEISRLGKNPARPVIIYCALGSSSLTAAQKLKKAGLQEVYSLRGGINGWLNANLPITAR